MGYGMSLGGGGESRIYSINSFIIIYYMNIYFDIGYYHFHHYLYDNIIFYLLNKFSLTFYIFIIIKYMIIYYTFVLINIIYNDK